MALVLLVLLVSLLAVCEQCPGGEGLVGPQSIAADAPTTQLLQSTCGNQLERQTGVNFQMGTKSGVCFFDCSSKIVLNPPLFNMGASSQIIIESYANVECSSCAFSEDSMIALSEYVSWVTEGTVALHKKAKISMSQNTGLNTAVGSEMEIGINGHISLDPRSELTLQEGAQLILENQGQPGYGISIRSSSKLTVEADVQCFVWGKVTIPPFTDRKWSVQSGEGFSCELVLFC